MRAGYYPLEAPATRGALEVGSRVAFMRQATPDAWIASYCRPELVLPIDEGDGRS